MKHYHNNGKGSEDREVRKLLKNLKVKPSKKKGQHFVTDDSIISLILEFGKPSSSETLVEIGPGTGALTHGLSAFEKLTVIELEDNFCKELRNQFPNVKVICNDVRKVKFDTLGRDLVIFGNLPYAFSTDIVFHLIENTQYLKRAVLLLQREFAERMAAPPGGRVYGVLSVMCQLWAHVSLGPIIPGDVFHPPTKVQSRLVSLEFLKEPKVAFEKEEWFRKVVKACFFRRRKKLQNSLLASGQFERTTIESALRESGIDGGRRAETLSLEEFGRLAKELL